MNYLGLCRFQSSGKVYEVVNGIKGYSKEHEMRLVYEETSASKSLDFNLLMGLI